MLQFLISMLGFLRVVAGHSALCLSLPKDVLWEIMCFGLLLAENSRHLLDSLGIKPEVEWI